MNSLKCLIKPLVPGILRQAIRDYASSKSRRGMLDRHRPRIEQIRDKLVRRANPIIVEIGAEHFLHTRLFLEVFPASQVFCFEPLPGAVESFQRELKDFGTRCRLFNCAAGNVSGRAELAIPLMKDEGAKAIVEWNGAASIKPTKDFCEQYPSLHFPSRVSVEVIRLDDWMRSVNPGRVDFVWADVQGAERDLIEGGQEFLKTVRFIQLEYGECGPYPGSAMSREETIALMGEHGFSLSLDFPQDTGLRGDLMFVNAAHE